ncbi:phosphoribosylamine--glycine ligase [Herbaspirillum sp. UBA812]|uniref:phosphoribosylamine--glycine ligase n=1 Tax=Herbaspirillum sp. UBA812 TaxID=1946590 RepID=UPI00257F6CBE|nr:phosphoribosylamine--glycine ligase [Herbaspirillum sp. UBA812]
MKILVVGSGGREHALAWAIAKSPRIQTVYVAPGNGGTALDERLQNIAITDPVALADFVEQEHVALTVVGPEGPLAAGIVNVFRARGLKIFGPTREAAQLESSKDFAKAFMQRHAIPTAEYQTFSDVAAAHDYIALKGAPIVIKADGLAAGKGVVVAMTLEEAHTAVDMMLSDNKLGDAGARVVIEEFLAGEEASFIVMVDGKNILPLATSQDHKRLQDHDQGPNTGGMGAYAPAPLLDAEGLEEVRRIVLEPTLKALRQRGIDYRGVIYAGLMITADGPQVIEFNCRFGDPECQTLMPLLGPELGAVLQACALGRLDLAPQLSIAERCSACVVAAAEGYPEAPRKGDAIRIDLAPSPNHQLFHAGTRRDSSGELLTAGGRVLAVVAQGDDFDAAFAGAYNGLNQLDYAGITYRRDIGHQVRSGG